jgi:hypothetical protein
MITLPGSWFAGKEVQGRSGTRGSRIFKEERNGANVELAGGCSVAVLAVFLVPASAQEGEKKVTIDQVPKAVKEAILKAVGKGKLVDIGVFEDAGKTVYEIEMVVDGKEYDVLFDSDGKVLNRRDEGAVKEGEEEGDEDGEGDSGKQKVKKETIELDKAPEAVQKAFRKEAGKNEIKQVLKLKQKGEIVYEAEWFVDGKSVELVVDPKGKVVSVTKQITLDDLPEAVKAAALKEVGSNKIEDVESVTQGDKTVYEVEYTKDGKEIDLKIASDGKIISSGATEEEGKEEEGKDKKEEKGKKEKKEKDEEDEGNEGNEDDD